MEHGMRALPKTIEGATKRYLDSYESQFVGSAADMYRLKDMARQFIYKLRKVAPDFYENRLAQLVNQAASTLLTFDTRNKDDVKKFHETHAYFLLVIQDLRQTQPAGEVNFQNERRRFEVRSRLIKRQGALAKKIEELNSQEFDLDDLGDDEYESQCEKNFSELEKLKKEQLEVNIEIALIDKVDFEEKLEFKLQVKPNSILNRLTKEQLRELERQMHEFYIANNKRKTAIYVDKAVIDDMIDKLDIDKSKFQIEELRHISKDALDAYKSFFRENDMKHRDYFHEALLESEALRPKEGLILTDPNCLPEHLKRQLDQNYQTQQERIHNILEEFGLRQDVEEVLPDEQVEDDSEEDDLDYTEEIRTTLKRKGIELNRVTEEPRDDYVEGEDDSEMEAY